jgi:hypothetical protein
LRLQVWNMDDPMVIAGFAFDRVATVDALSKQPPGTFVVRLSVSQPGALVLSLRTGPSHPQADAQGCLHAIIKAADLWERRLEAWLRDMPGATHVLDVAKGRRVDKRRVFASSHVRLAMLDTVPAVEEAGQEATAG